MNAEPLLGEVAREMLAVSLEAVLIGDAAAALQVAPVTTIDFDFLFRKTPRNMAKMKALARALRATIFRPYYPASDFYRLMRDRDSLRVTFIPAPRRIILPTRVRVATKKPRPKDKLAALAREAERADRELIERWQRLPPGRRTQFLRKRVGPGRTAL